MITHLSCDANTGRIEMKIDCDSMEEQEQLIDELITKLGVKLELVEIKNLIGEKVQGY